MASVIPLVIDAGRILCLDVASETEGDIRSALGDVRLLLSPAGSANDLGLALQRGRTE